MQMLNDSCLHDDSNRNVVFVCSESANRLKQTLSESLRDRGFTIQISKTAAPQKIVDKTERNWCGFCKCSRPLSSLLAIGIGGVRQRLCV